MTFELNGPVIERRLALKTDVNFKLETGFLAEQINCRENAWQKLPMKYISGIIP